MVDEQKDKKEVVQDFGTDIRVNADIDLAPGTVITPRVVTTGMFKTVQPKETFAQVIAPLSNILTNIKNFIDRKAVGIKDNKYVVEQLRLEIEADVAEIEEAEGSAEFIEQVIAARKTLKNK